MTDKEISNKRIVLSIIIGMLLVYIVLGKDQPLTIGLIFGIIIVGLIAALGLLVFTSMFETINQTSIFSDFNIIKLFITSNKIKTIVIIITWLLLNIYNIITYQKLDLIIQNLFNSSVGCIIILFIWYLFEWLLGYAFEHKIAFSLICAFFYASISSINREHDFLQFVANLFVMYYICYFLLYISHYIIKFIKNKRTF